MVNQTFYDLGTAPSVIRKLFAYGLEQAKIVGSENVFDYSLGNPSIPAPKKVNESIHKLVRQYARQGMAVIMSSSDMTELIGASDRVVALYEGEVTGELQLDEITEDRIMSLTSGIRLNIKENA